MPAAYAPVQEVRFATVMYGGVSLAIYINGVAQELFSLVRATAPAKGTDGEAFFEDEQLTPAERVYREVGRRLRGDGTWCPDTPGEPIRTRFVVDILSGSSAGGINGIFLAKALARGEDFSSLRQLWVDEANIDKLLNEPASWSDLGAFRYADPPQSLLVGPRLYMQALRRLAGMTPLAGPDDPRAPNLADQVDLAVTTTDLQGLWTPIRLSDGAVSEPRHRVVMRFGYSTDDSTGDAHDDFDPDAVQRLAFAARATSSFPVAFEPVLPADAPPDDPAAFHKALLPGYPAAAGNPAEGAWRQWAFADGGYLDNKPFTQATSTLRRRRADLPVDRKLLYIEPDPAAEPAPTDEPTANPRPDAFGAAGAGLSLPRIESIREDISALLERNAAIERVRSVTRGIELMVLGEAKPAPLPVSVRLEVLEDLTSLVLRAANQDRQGDEAAFAWVLLDAWAPDVDDPGGDVANGVATLEAFLDRFDLRYRLRRAALLNDRINDLLLQRGSRELLRAVGVETTAADAAEQGARWLLARKVLLNEQVAELRRLGRSARARDQVSRGSDLAAAIAGFGFATGAVAEVLGAEDPAAAAGELLQAAGTGAALERFEAALEDRFGSAFSEADKTIRKALAAPRAKPVHRDLATLLRAYFDRFEAIDRTTLPLLYPDLREANPVEIFRVSPVDAQSLVEDGGRGRLGGVAFGHFGGFLDARWRQADLLWGRLDGAERLLAAVVPDEDDRRSLTTRVQGEILRDELRATDALVDLLHPSHRAPMRRALRDEDSSPEDLVAAFRAGYAGPVKADTAALLPLSGRAAAVTGRLLDGLADRHRALRAPLRGTARVAHLFGGSVQVVGRVRAGVGRVLRRIGIGGG